MVQFYLLYKYGLKNIGGIKMKREYVKPVFIAETYAFSESIAACDYHQGDTEANPVIIPANVHMCPVNDGGHVTGKKGIPVSKYPVSVFNDGDATGCTFDWEKNGIVKFDGVIYPSFGQALFGAKANNENHTIIYNGKVFFS